MKKIILFLTISLLTTNSFCQIGPASTPSSLSTMVQAPLIGITTWRTIAPNPIYDVIVAKGTESWTNNAWSIILPNYATLRDDGFPKRLVYIDSLTGALKVSGNYALDARYLKLSDSTLYTTRYYLQNNFYTKTQSDSRYLQSFTEVDPIFTTHVAFGITVTNISNWNTAYGWGNHAGLYPTHNGTGATGTWNIGISGNASTVTNGVYTTGSYSNPIWLTSLAWSKITGAPSIYSFTGTSSQYTKGDGTYATFPTTVSTFTNDAGYLTGITSGQITTALGYTPVSNNRTLTINGLSQDLTADRTWNVGDVLTSGSYSNPSWITSLANTKITYSGTTSQYVRGDGSLTTLPVQVNSDWNSISGVSQILNKPTLFSGDYNDLTNKPNLSIYYLASNPSGFVSNLSSFTTTNLAEGSNLYWTSARFNTAFSGKTTTDLTEGSNLYFTNARARASLSQGTGISYNSTTGVITNSAPDQTVIINAGAGMSVTGLYPSFTITNTQATPTINNNISRTLNSNYTISTTQLAEVSYSVTCSVTNPLLAGTSTASAFLEYSTNGGSTWITINQTGNTSGVGIAVAIAITNTQTTTLTATIPANALVRLRTTTSGTASVTYVTGQEVLY